MNYQDWNKKTYEDFTKYLISIKDDNYKNFHSKICETKYEILGIRLPKVRMIVKEILKTDYQKFLGLVNSNYYEEVMIEGLVISSIKDEKLFFEYFSKYIEKIDCWGITDSVCNSTKILDKNEIKDKYFNYFKKLSLNKKEFVARVGLVTILNYYISQKYIKDIFALLNEIKSDKYYINMARAWLICELYVYYPLETEKFLKNNKLDSFTQNKAISKIRDSYRINKEKKEYLSTLKK